MEKPKSFQQRAMVVFCGLFLCLMVLSIVLSSALFVAQKPAGLATTTIPVIGGPTDLCVNSRGGTGSDKILTTTNSRLIICI